LSGNCYHAQACTLTIQQQKHTVLAPPKVIQPIISLLPGERFQLDLINLSSYKQDNDNYQYIMTLIDHFSGYTWLRPLLFKSAEQVYQQLQPILCSDPCNLLQSDNGKEFTAELITELLEQYDIKIVHGAPYTPSTQGRVERMNQTVKKALGMITAIHVFTLPLQPSISLKLIPPGGWIGCLL
jgi:hypothetical protein